ncbi:hypothetical protein JQN72_17620 [Phycicoccus sp. CSK15P-2]|uniref:LysM peptidoglycan-binding domain-containing protein n=1 Tax=Phycicoccus sp. CSK15P-2 TaxID=2807627 RepID=UPI00194E1C1F|nr:hypothetical protein [Phycicoccus sp. CSK15P-2]MBM6406059.1 hypothetical protein [Phycicoccus sp. CSK15P-2]
MSTRWHGVPTRSERGTTRGALVAILAGALFLVGLTDASGAESPSPSASPSPSSTAQPTPAPVPTGEVKYYIVASEYEGEPEFLYEIAERMLGSGDRAMEIFLLNQGRRQPGGLIVSDPEVIKPGWVLELPADASGPEVRVGPLPTFAPLPGASAPAAPTAPGAAPEAASGEEGAFSSTWWVVAAAVGAALVATLVVVLALRSRRDRENAAPPAPRRPAALERSTARPPGSHRALRPGRRERPPAPTPLDSSVSWMVDRALRVLASACRAAGRTLPEVAMVVVGPEHLSLRLLSPDDMTPSGWAARDFGRTWASSLRHLQTAAVDDTLDDPLPQLVTVGGTAQGRVLVDLARARGVVAVDGDGAGQRHLLDIWMHELTTNPWSREVRVVRVAVAAPVPAGSKVVDIADVGGLDDVVDGAPAGMVVLARAPRGRDLERVTALAGGTVGPRWGVVVLGGLRDARWRFTCDGSGRVTTPLLDEPVVMAALPEARVERA